MPKILSLPNFYDRISLKYALNPFNVEDTKKMIQFRLAKAGSVSAKPFFTDQAIEEIHRYTMGYPRRITMLCHKALKQLIMSKKSEVDLAIVREVIAAETVLVFVDDTAHKQPPLAELAVVIVEGLNGFHQGFEGGSAAERCDDLSSSRRDDHG